MAVRFQFDFDRAFAACVYIAFKKPKNLDVYKMCKLIFLSDKLHLVRYGRPITGDDIRAMDYGPVPSAVYDLLKFLAAGNINDDEVRIMADHLAVDERYKYPHLSCARSIEFEEYLSKSDMEAIDETIAIHGGKGFEELKLLTHQMPSWKNAWDDPQRTSNNPRMAIEDLFLEDSEAIAGVKEEMVEDYEIRRSFHAAFCCYSSSVYSYQASISVSTIT